MNGRISEKDPKRPKHEERKREMRIIIHSAGDTGDRAST